MDQEDKVLSPKLDDDDTLQEYESDQPTHDEDTMDGVTPGRTADTEVSYQGYPVGHCPVRIELLKLLAVADEQS